jgi:alkyl sulfatase BDS1-like metallo-beta-lactamase superfamily hydrolase
VKTVLYFPLALLMVWWLAACNEGSTPTASQGRATAAMLASNAAMSKVLALDDPQDFEDAKRGFIAKPSGQLKAADGTLLKDHGAYDFIKGSAPDTVNPSLWRHAQLNAQTGLFKVVDGIYQLRGFDIANMTLIEGQTGWIVVDPLTSRESAAAALAFARQHLGDKAVSAVIFTHSHADHFGGVLGVVSPEEVKQRGLPVIAPEGFMDEATSENILVGTGMGRRSMYQFGKNLERSAIGNLDTGLGKDVVYGTLGILQPNVTIHEKSQEMTVDGLQFVFHNVPGAEAPAELTFNVPKYKAYGGAENLSQTMHNLLPVRGAKVRDSLRWSGYMDDALEQAAQSEVYFGQHNWPVWGQARIAEFIAHHRDVYKYTHDQTVRLINAGLTADEIADQVKLPAALASYFGTRGYYGDLRHNVKAVYQFYMGFYDGNPAHLDPLPPQELSKRYIDLIGGADKAVAAAQTAFDKGDFRWAAELLNRAVFAQPDHRAAKELLARTYEQMAYGSEASTWRNSYLTAALELRTGTPKAGISKEKFIEALNQTPIERFLEAMAASLNGPKADGVKLKLNLVLTDIHESHVLWIENSVLHHKAMTAAADANATLSLSKPLFVRMIAGTAGAKEMLLSDDLKVEGSKLDLARFFSLLDKATGDFPIVTR